MEDEWKRHRPHWEHGWDHKEAWRREPAWAREPPRWEPAYEPPRWEPREEPRWDPGDAWRRPGTSWEPPRWEPRDQWGYGGWGYGDQWGAGYGWREADRYEHKPQPLGLDFLQPAWEDRRESERREAELSAARVESPAEPGRGLSAAETGRQAGAAEQLEETGRPTAGYAEEGGGSESYGPAQRAGAPSWREAGEAPRELSPPHEPTPHEALRWEHAAELRELGGYVDFKSSEAAARPERETLHEARLYELTPQELRAEPPRLDSTEAGEPPREADRLLHEPPRAEALESRGAGEEAAREMAKSYAPEAYRDVEEAIRREAVGGRPLEAYGEADRYEAGRPIGVEAAEERPMSEIAREEAKAAASLEANRAMGWAERPAGWPEYAKEATIGNYAEEARRAEARDYAEEAKRAVHLVEYSAEASRGRAEGATSLPEAPVPGSAVFEYARAAEETRRAVVEAGLKFADAARAVWDKAYRAVEIAERELGRLAGGQVAVDAAKAPIAAAIAYAEARRFEETVERAKEAAQRIYESAKELWEKAKVTLERIYEIVVEAIARALDYVRAHWFLMAAAAAGLIAWAVAQQLDHALWMNHVAVYASLIAGIPPAKAKAVLEEKEPELYKAAEFACSVKSVEAAKRLFEAARKAMYGGGEKSDEEKPKDREMLLAWHKLRETVKNVNKYREPEERLRAEDLAALWAVFEAYLKEVGRRAEETLQEVEKAVEELLRAGVAEVSAGRIAEFEEFTRRVAYDFEAFCDVVVRNAEEIAGRENAQALRNVFAITDLADELAEATTKEFRMLGSATPADKVKAFFKGLAEGSSWSHVVMNAVKVGEAYRALALAPITAHNYYGSGVEADEKKGWREIVARTAEWLHKMGIERFALRRNGDVVEIVVGKAVAVVETKAIREGGVAFEAVGEWARAYAEDAVKRLGKVEKGEAEPYQVRALLATDGSYDATSNAVYAGTTSLVQAARLKRLGFEAYPSERVSLTMDGPKPELYAALSGDGARRVIGLVKEDLKGGVKRLRGDVGLRSRLLAEALELLGKVAISVQGIDEETEEGRRIVEEEREKIADRIKKFLNELRLGEGGRVCLAGCQFGEKTLTVEHESYARFVAPFIHYIAADAPREEVMKFVAELILYDGSMSLDYVYLAVGNFHVGDRSKALPLDVYDKLALFLIFAAKYGVGVKEVYIIQTSDNADAAKKAGMTIIYFDREYAAEILAEAWAGLHVDWRFGGEQLYADHLFRKLEKVRGYVEEWVENVKIEHVVRGDKATVFFKDEADREIAHINLRWDGEGLHADFGGSKEKAERLAAILNVLGADVETKEYSGKWFVQLYTDSITAIRRKEWLDAVRALVEALYERGVIDDEKKEELLREIEAGPNVIEIAGVELSVKVAEAEIKSGKSMNFVILYKTTSPTAFDQAVNALKAAGFEEEAHFTAKRPEGKEEGHIYLKKPAGLWKLVELEKQGVEWAEKALDKLEEIAKARGFYDLLERYLKPAKTAGTVDPRGMVVEDKERGIRAVIKDVKLEWENGRPRITIEYEASGHKQSFYFTWGKKGDEIRAKVNLNYERAAVLAALTGDEKLKGKRGSRNLTTKHLLAFAKYKGVGWELLWWYAKMMGDAERVQKTF